MADDKSNAKSQLTEEDLYRIKNFQVGELPKNSGFVHPFRAKFMDERINNPVQRQWDAIDAHVKLSIHHYVTYVVIVSFSLISRVLSL